MAVTSQAVQAKNDLRIGDKIFTFLKYFLLILFSAIALIPVSVCVLTAFKTTDEYNTTNVLTPPENWLNFDNFVTAFERANMLRGFLNTGIALVFVLLFSILISSMLAYVLNRFRFPGSGLIHNLFMFASLIPGIATQVTVYQIMFSLGLINHLYGYILVLCGTDIISIYIFLQFFENLPRALDESAILDGCTYFGVFFKIGAFTFGGGYAMIPLIQKEVVTARGWVSDEDILNIIAIAESTPGPIAINSATFIGYRVCGVLGSFFATLGVVLPSFIVISLLSFVIARFKSLTAVQYAFNGIRAGVLALIVKALISMYRQCPKGLASYIVIAASFVAVALFEISVLPVLIGCAIFGLVWSLAVTGRQK